MQAKLICPEITSCMATKCPKCRWRKHCPCSVSQISCPVCIVLAWYCGWRWQSGHWEQTYSLTPKIMHVTHYQHHPSIMAGSPGRKQRPPKPARWSTMWSSPLRLSSVGVCLHGSSQLTGILWFWLQGRASSREFSSKFSSWQLTLQQRRLHFILPSYSTQW